MHIHLQAIIIIGVSISRLLALLENVVDLVDKLLKTFCSSLISKMNFEKESLQSLIFRHSGRSMCGLCVDYIVEVHVHVIC